jgi:hypothetical protein
MRAYQCGHMVRVWSRPDKGSLYGAFCGHCRYTHVFPQRLSAMTSFDVMLEGFPTWTVEEFLLAKFPGVPTETEVLVLMFMFYPRH